MQLYSKVHKHVQLLSFPAAHQNEKEKESEDGSRSGARSCPALGPAMIAV